MSGLVDGIQRETPQSSAIAETHAVSSQSGKPLAHQPPAKNNASVVLSQSAVPAGPKEAPSQSPDQDAASSGETFPPLPTTKPKSEIFSPPSQSPVQTRMALGVPSAPEQQESISDNNKLADPKDTETALQGDAESASEAEISPGEIGEGVSQPAWAQAVFDTD